MPREFEDFGFLDDESIRNTQALAVSGQNLRQQNEDLSDTLNRITPEIKKVVANKQNSDIFFTAQSNQLAEASDKKVNEVLRAKADPFHAIKVLFTDEKSLSDLAVEQNNIQNQMNNVQRRFAGGQSEFNAEITDIQNEIGTARAKRKLTAEGIQGLQATATAISTSVASRINVQKNEILNLTLPDLQREFADPDSRLKKGLVREQIDALLAVSDARRTSKGESLLKRQVAIDKAIKDNATAFPNDIVDTAISTGQSQFIPSMGITLTPQMAAQLLPLQQVAQEESAKRIADLTTNKLAAQQGIFNSTRAMKRFAGPGTDIFLRENGKPIGIDSTAFSAESKAAIVNLENQKLLLDQFDQRIGGDRLAGIPPAVGPQLTQLRIAQQQLEAKIAIDSEALDDKLGDEKANEFEDEEAKSSTKNWIINGNMTSPSGSTKVMTESFAVAIPQAEDSDVHGLGWGAGALVSSTNFQRQVRDDAGDSTEFLGDDERLTDQQLFLKLQGTIRGKTLAETSMSKALNTMTPDKQNNAARVAILNDWYQVALIKGTEEVIANHPNEPETARLLSQFSANGVTLAGQVVTFQTPEGEGDAFQFMFAKLRMDELDMLKANPELKDMNLTTEFMRTLMPRTGAGSASQFYARPDIVGMTRPDSSPVAGALARLLFRNQQNAVFKAGMGGNLRGIPLDNIDAAIAAVDAEFELRKLPSQTGIATDRLQGGGLPAPDLRAVELSKIKRPEGASLFNIILQIRKDQQNR